MKMRMTVIIMTMPKTNKTDGDTTITNNDNNDDNGNIV